MFKVGDLVSRDGTDVHRIIAVNGAGDLIDVECIREPLGYLNDDGSRDTPWTRLGETEIGLASRYDHVGAVIDHVGKMGPSWPLLLRG